MVNVITSWCQSSVVAISEFAKHRMRGQNNDKALRYPSVRVDLL